ncbi:UvrD-helicase domain-containing protein [Haloferula sp.]|uniref:UvrD-helicase domain-containing protein n=1 Tax=Haloferula sp. TaxID=2497595 RepID=UPI00329C667A
MDLNLEQRQAVEHDGNAVVTACPGSGKTRVLTARVMRAVNQLESSKERAAALTFTNRAADEIRSRLDQDGLPTDLLWAGTIHAFALEWILRPYAPYVEQIRCGFSVADEYFCERLLREIHGKQELERFATINTVYRRDGIVENSDEETEAAFDLYRRELRESKVIDYNEVLYLAYKLLEDNPEIAANLGSIFRVFCVDEVQDIQDLQFGILSQIYSQSPEPPEMLFVGDADQSIYESLGALTKSPEEIAEEFGMTNLQHFDLVGNYRSTQRVIDYCRLFRPAVAQVESRIAQPEEHGRITFEKQTVSRDDLSDHIAELVRATLRAGIDEDEICIIAPRWDHVRSIARQLVERLPDARFDAPGLSPLYSVRDNIWYRVAKLCLTNPTPSSSRSRSRCANEVLVELEFLLGSSVPDSIASARRLLRVINQLESDETEGIRYLRDLFTQLLERVGLNLDALVALKDSFELFFEKAEARLESSEGGMPSSVDSFRMIFSSPSGIVVNTCHGVKGEEFDTVIAFGLLKGFVPHWDVIINGSEAEAAQRESKLLYVVASRAKRQLHLVSENGRRTQTGNPYRTATLLDRINFDYD